MSDPLRQIGPYAVIGEIGAGGFAKVYKVRAPDAQERALKLLFTQDLQALARFDREQRLLLELSQEQGFVPIVDRGQSPWGPYLVMPLMTSSLADLISQQGTLDFDVATDIVMSLAQSLGRAHERGIIHRDLKPHNVLFNNEGRPLISDFGLAKHTHEARQNHALSVSLSTQGQAYGTIAYMPPEQSEYFKDLGPTADVFSLSAIYYECLTGVPPFGKDNSVAVAVRVGKGQFQPVREFRDDCPQALEEFFCAGLSSEPEERFEDGHDFASALDLALVDSGSQGIRRWAVVFSTLVLVLTVSITVFVRQRSAAKTVTKDKSQAPEEPEKGNKPEEPEKTEPPAKRDEPVKKPEPELRPEDVPYQLQKAIKQPGLTLTQVLGEFRGRHMALVSSVAFSPGGRWVVSGSLDGSCRLWDAKSGEEWRCFNVSPAAVQRVRFSPSGHLFMYACSDGRLFVKNLKTDAKPRVIRLGSESLSDCVFLGHDQAIAIAAGNSVSIINLRRNSREAHFQPHGPAKGRITHLAYCPSEKYFVSAMAGELRAWSATGKGLSRKRIGTVAEGFCFDAKSQRLLVGNRQGRAFLFDFRTGGELTFQPLRRPTPLRYVRALAFLGRDQILVGGNDNTLSLWRIDKAAVQFEQEVGKHTGWIHALAVHPSGRYAITGSNDQNLELWNLQTWSQVWTKTGHRSRVFGFCQEPNGQCLLSLDNDSVVKRWDWPSGKPRRGVDFGPGFPEFRRDHAANKLIVFGIGSKIMELSLEGLSPTERIPEEALSTLTLQPPSTQLLYLAVFQQMFVGMTRQGSLRFWHRGSGRLAREATERFDRRLVQLYGDADRLVLPLKSGVVKCLDLQGQLVHQFQAGAALSRTAYNNRSRELILARADGVLELWNLKDMQRRALIELPGAKFVPQALALSGDGQWLAVHSSKILYLWSIETQKLHAQVNLGRCEGWWTALQFEDDHKHLLCGHARGPVLRFRITED